MDGVKRVLIGCEESQVVCKAFRDRGYEAYSCDLVDTRGNPAWHIKGDVMDHLDGWDLIILHPVCTAMALSGNAHYGRGKPKHPMRIQSINWTVNLWIEATKRCKRVRLENPKSVIFPVLRGMGARVQYIHPWQFGHMEMKETGFALHGVEPLVETANVYDEMMLLPRREREKTHFMSPGPNRARDRSVTFQGIADALADQCGWPAWMI